MSSYDDDDRDDRPRRRRRDDDFDRPPQKSNSNTLIILLVVGGVVALGCCGAVGIGLLLPAVQKVRDAAERAKDTNNLKEISLGVHGYSDTNRSLPPATGNLSWRVHILPYIEQENLYRDFNLDQPWDGPENRRLADITVRPFTRGDAPVSPATPYRVFVGPGTLYEPGEKPLPRADIKDGASNTIFAVEAAETVPWPQPKELPFTPNGPLPSLGLPNRDVVLVLMADGSVKAVARDRLDPTLLRALITPVGKDQVPRDW